MHFKDLFEIKSGSNSDIRDHLNRMVEIASRASCVVEFGVRAGNSTAAWIAARPRKLFSYDWRVPEEIDLFRSAAESAGVEFSFSQADTSNLQSIPECDILFIDTLHTRSQVESELKHHTSVRRHIILHDTETFKINGEGGEEGIWKAVTGFLESNPEWYISEHHSHCNGLTVLSRGN